MSTAAIRLLSVLYSLSAFWPFYIVETTLCVYIEMNKCLGCVIEFSVGGHKPLLCLPSFNVVLQCIGHYRNSMYVSSNSNWSTLVSMTELLEELFVWPVAAVIMLH